MLRTIDVKDRVYLANSKIYVRRKLGLDEEQNDEDFSNFEVDHSFTNIFLTGLTGPSRVYVIEFTDSSLPSILKSNGVTWMDRRWLPPRT